MFAGTHDRAVQGVQVHFVVIGDVSQHTHALKNMNVLAGIRDARQVKEVLTGRVAVGIVLRIRNHDRRACSSKVDPGSRKRDIVQRILAVEYEISVSLLHGPLQCCSWHAEAAVVS